jgi:hypothetical protein
VTSSLSGTRSNQLSYESLEVRNRRRRRCDWFALPPGARQSPRTSAHLLSPLADAASSDEL